MKISVNQSNQQGNPEELPLRQRDVLQLISTLTAQHGYPPTLAELARAMGLKNRMTVHQHLAALKRKGFVRWEPGLNRSLQVIGGQNLPLHLAYSAADQTDLKPPSGLPLFGAIAAGSPIAAMQTDDYIEIDKPYKDAGCFALKVKGDSMIEAGIFGGDYVIVKPNPSPKNGDVVVALLADNEATLKRFYKENGQFRLQPANKDYAPIMLDRYEDINIQGVVVGLFRKL